MSYTTQGDFHVIVKGRHSSGGDVTAAPYAASLVIDRNEPSTGKPSYRVIIRLTGAAMDELAWKPGDYITPLEGTGKSAGKLLLVTADKPERGYKLSPNSEARGRKNPILQTPRAGSDTPSCIIAIGAGGIRHHTLPTERFTQQPVEGRAFNGELLLTMPSWFEPKEDSTSQTNGRHGRKGR